MSRARDIMAPMGREPAEVARSLKDGDQVGGYVIEARIGVGGFGEVYRARHPVIGREVAIKVLHRKYSADPEAVARFVAEARSVNQISHPKIVEVFDFGKLDDGREFCVMELIAGTTLREVLRERTRLPLAEALPILRGIAEAVDAAHAAGIAHRDLKPDNVFVLADGGTKLIDFGLAKLTRELDAPVTVTGSVFGTPIYMSPEQCRGKATDTRTDLYSFGVLAYQVLTGEPPFGGDALELALHHLNDRPEPPSQRCKELTRNADRVVLALLAKDPADRPASLVNAIDALAGATTLRARRWKRRARWTAMIAVPLALAATVVVMWPSTGDASECAPAAERLVGIWDPQIRAAIETRFAGVKRRDIPGTWRAVATELDGTTNRWSAEWDRACNSGERATDPLLHQQRLNCLENVLLELGGATASMKTIDIALFSTGWVGGLNAGIQPEDCARAEVARAQPPGSRPEQRAEITRLLIEINRLRADARASQNAGQPDGLEPALARLEEISNRLEVLGAPVAAEAAALHAHYFLPVALADPKRIPAMRRAIATALRRAEAIRDDRTLTFAYVLLARLEMAPVDRDDAKVDDALDRAEAGYNRAGRPRLWNGRTPDSVRVDVLALRGQLEQAMALHPNEPRTDEALPLLLARLGRHAEAIASTRGQLDTARATFGPIHTSTARIDGLLEHALARSGDVDGALAEADRIFEVHRELHASAATLKNDRFWQLVYAMRLGRTELAAKAAVAMVRGEAAANDTPLTAIEWSQIADMAIGLGAIELLRVALDREVDPSVEVNGGGDWIDTRAYVDFMIGDLASMVEHALRVAPFPSNVTITQASFRGAPWDLALADVAAGRRSAAEAKLSALALVHYASDDVAAGGTIGNREVLAALGRWLEAKTAFEKARAMPAWLRDWNLAEIDAWLGLAQLETNDPTAAVKSLEESLGVLMECCDGFHYYAPMAQLALARALWQTNGNKVRARGLAEAARNGYARLGKFREPERQQAIRWLAEHEAP